MRRGLTLLAALAIAGCGTSEVREPPAPLVDFKPSAKVTRVWRASAGRATHDYVGLAPALVGDAVYAADRRGRVSAYAAVDGRRLWRTRLNVRASGAVGAGADLVLVGTRDGLIIALDRATGKERWRAAVASEVLALPAEAAGIVVVQTADGRLYGFATGDGKLLWVQDRAEPSLSLRGTSGPIIVGNVVYTGFASGKIAAVAIKDGRMLWETTVALPHGRSEIERLVDVDASPVVRDDMLYAVAYQGRLIAVDLRAGSVAWSRDVSSHAGLAVDGAHVYVSDAHGEVWAFDRATGANVWRQDKLRGRALNAPARVGDYLAVGDFDGYVHWLALDDGAMVARLRIDNAPIRSPAAVSTDILYVTTHDGRLAALRVQSKK